MTTTNMKQISIHICKLVLTFICASICLVNIVSAETIIEGSFRSFVDNAKNSTTLSIHQYRKLYQFYEYNHFALVWFATVEDSNKRNSLLHLVSNADLFALNATEYHVQQLSKNIHYTSSTDTFITEILLTDAAISFMHDLAFGGDKQFVKYNGLQYHPNDVDLVSTLHETIRNGALQSQLTIVEPQGQEFTCLKEEYLKLLTLSKNKEFSDVKVTSKELKPSNTSLVIKLRQLGYLSESDTTTAGLLTAVQKFQRQHKLTLQKSLNASALQALNKPISHKLEELAWNISWYRWLNGMRDKPHLVVNIPANNVVYYEDGNRQFECSIVVGKISTPTPTLASVIKNVVYYPYWNVPTSIAVKEMLPILKRNPGYLQRQRLQVLQNGHAVSGVNWHAYSASNFPFQLRQRTGCSNALGRLKFDFENPFHVYLHDTNAKMVFAASKRFFSHGCMRVEKPYELALALGVNPKRIDMSNCLENKTPEIVPLPKPVPVFVIYATIDIKNGELEWYEDAYKKIRSGDGADKR